MKIGRALNCFFNLQLLILLWRKKWRGAAGVAPLLRRGKGLCPLPHVGSAPDQDGHIIYVILLFE